MTLRNFRPTFDLSVEPMGELMIFPKLYKSRSSKTHTNS